MGWQEGHSIPLESPSYPPRTKKARRIPQTQAGSLPCPALNSTILGIGKAGKWTGIRQEARQSPVSDVCWQPRTPVDSGLSIKCFQQTVACWVSVKFSLSCILFYMNLKRIRRFAILNSESSSLTYSLWTSIWVFIRKQRSLLSPHSWQSTSAWILFQGQGEHQLC